MLLTVYVVQCSNFKLTAVFFAASNIQSRQEVPQNIHTYEHTHILMLTFGTYIYVNVNINVCKIKNVHNIENFQFYLVLCFTGNK